MCGSMQPVRERVQIQSPVADPSNRFRLQEGAFTLSIASSTAVDAGAATNSSAAFTPAYRWYALGLLFLVYVFNFVDRSILTLLAQPIKDEFQVSDTMIGLLSGPSFGLFYSILGIPIARLADRSVRRNVLVICLTVWSAMTAVCGLVLNFWQLMAARIGVAVGEAGGSPPSHSMISDMFPQAQRATALGIYALGIPVGSMFGALAGGWINEALSWRAAFLVVGLPGLLLAVLVRLTLREPPRGASEPRSELADTSTSTSDSTSDSTSAPTNASTSATRTATASPNTEMPTFAEVLRVLWSRRSFRFMALAAGFHGFVGYGVGAFIPAMFMRVHGMGSADVGTAMFFQGFAGIFGTFSAGFLADRLGRRDPRWYMWLPAIAAVLSLPFSIAVYLWTDAAQALWIYAIPNILGSYYLAPSFAMTQGLVGVRMRALAAAVLLFMLTIIGLCLGPFLVGVMSDYIASHSSLGVDSLRYALCVATLVVLAAAIANLLAARTLAADLANAASGR